MLCKEAVNITLKESEMGLTCLRDRNDFAIVTPTCFGQVLRELSCFATSCLAN
jgi:hypothetical protein